jgi:hypothetical protein
MTEQQQRFFERAKLGVTNPNAITEAIAKTALDAAIYEVGNITEHLLFDVAMLRLKILLKVELTEDDWRLFRNAKSQIGKTELTPKTVYATQARTSTWDM